MDIMDTLLLADWNEMIEYYDIVVEPILQVLGLQPYLEEMHSSYRERRHETEILGNTEDNYIEVPEDKYLYL